MTDGVKQFIWKAKLADMYIDGIEKRISDMRELDNELNQTQTPGMTPVRIESLLTFPAIWRRKGIR